MSADSGIGAERASLLVSAVFQCWKEAKLEFVVLRNYEALPQFTSNDIDVLVRPEEVERAEQLLLSAAGQAGFRLHNRAEFATLAIYLFDPRSNAQVHFDLFSGLRWRSLDFLEPDTFFAAKVDRGLFYVPHPGHEAATNLLATLIYTGKVKEKYKSSIAAGFRAGPEAAETLLAASYGTQLGATLVRLGAQGSWQEIERLTGVLRRRLVVRQMCSHPWRLLSSSLRDAGRLWRRLRRRPGLVVVLCGVDGSGKSTVAERLQAGLKPTFSPEKSAHFHWKPWVTTGRSGARSATDPHGQKVRNRVSSLFYFGFHWLEFVLGSVLTLVPMTFRGGLAVIDRFYYDFFVDQRRYRLRVPRWLVLLGYALVKKPDLVLVLDAPSDLLQKRKQEITAEESERQRQEYRALASRLKQGRVVDATNRPETVAAEAERIILEFMGERMKKRGYEVPEASRILVASAQR